VLNIAATHSAACGGTLRPGRAAALWVLHADPLVLPLLLLQNRQTPLHKAAGYGQEDVVVRLLDAQAVVDAPDEV
jgi:hypothetical protein